MMEKAFTTIRVLLVLTILLGFWVTSAGALGIPIWTEDFEGNWQDCWHADAGTWDIGTPTSGPGGAYGGDTCVATGLDDNYSNYVGSMLISPPPFEL